MGLQTVSRTRSQHPGGGRVGVGTVIIDPCQRNEPRCRYVTGEEIVEGVDRGCSGGTAFLELPVQPRGSLAGVGNAVANPIKVLYKMSVGMGKQRGEHKHVDRLRGDSVPDG